MSNIKFLIDERNESLVTLENGKFVKLSIAKAKVKAGCSDSKDREARQKIKEKIVEIESALFKRNGDYKRMVELEQFYQVINAKIEKEESHKRKAKSAPSEDSQKKCVLSQTYTFLMPKLIQDISTNQVTQDKVIHDTVSANFISIEETVDVLLSLHEES
jgi:hypothetical protein